MKSRSHLIADVVIAAGLGAFYSWFLLVLRLLAFSSPNEALGFAARLTMDGAIIAAFGFVLLFSRYVFPLNKRFQPPFLLLAPVGVFLVAYNSLLGQAGFALCVMGMVCIGLEYGWLTLVWVELFGLLKSPRYIYQLVSAIFVAAGVMSVASLLPFVIFVFLTAVLPIISTVCLPLAYRLLEAGDDSFLARQQRFKKPGQDFSLRTLSNKTGFFRLLAASAVTFFVYGFVFSLVSVGILQKELPEGFLRAIGFTGAGSLLLAFMLLSRHRLVVSHIYLALQPVFIAGLLFIGVNTLVGEALASMSYMMMMVMCAVSLCEIGRRFETPVFHLAAFVYGIGTVGCCLGICLGFLSVQLLPGGLAAHPYSIWVLIIGLTIFTAVTSKHGGFTFNIDKDQVADANGEQPASAPEETNSDLAACKVAYYEALARRSATLGDRFCLTERETQILGLLMRNLSTESISEELRLSPNTVKVHTHNIFEKLGVHKRSKLTELVLTEL